MVHQAGRVPHDLLGHTADVDAGASHGTGLDNRDSGAVFSRTARVGNAAAAAAYDN